MSDNDFKLMMMRAKHKAQMIQVTEENDELRIDKRITEQREQKALRELSEERGKTAALSGLLQQGLVQPPAPLVPQVSKVMLSEAINEFLDKYPRDKKAGMFAKHKSNLPLLLLSIIGDKPISEVKQADLIKFSEEVQKLPPKWTDAARRQKCTLHDLLSQKHDKTITKATYDGSYMTSVRSFLKWAKTFKKDDGFPQDLVLDGLEYRGDREVGEDKQRYMKLNELKVLFEGDEAQKIAANPVHSYRYWFMLLGLYTGARINELCQINPQTDIFEEDGVWCLHITDKTPGDPRIRKHVKNKSSCRKVPIHTKLIELGFLEYVEDVKRSGAMLLFPNWTPEKQRAAAKPEKWFRAHLRKIKLRDDTPGEKLSGFHSFRHTILTYADHQNVAGAFVITGHVDEGKTGVQRGYTGQKELPIKKQTLESIDFGVEPLKPRRTRL